MNKNSGMLGLTETSNDMREIEQEAAHGSERHQLALEIYCHHVKKHIGAYMAEMGGVDAVVFTGGIGENSRLVRRLATEGLEEFGIRLDAAKNEANETVVSSGRVKLLVVPTNEELAIARDARRILEARKLPAEPCPAAEPAPARPAALPPGRRGPAGPPVGPRSLKPERRVPGPEVGPGGRPAGRRRACRPGAFEAQPGVRRRRRQETGQEKKRVKDHDHGQDRPRRSRLAGRPGLAERPGGDGPRFPRHAAVGLQRQGLRALPSSTTSISSATNTGCRSRNPPPSGPPSRTTSRSASPGVCSGTRTRSSSSTSIPSTWRSRSTTASILKSCQALIDQGFSVRDLTCARIGSFPGGRQGPGQHRLRVPGDLVQHRRRLQGLHREDLRCRKRLSLRWTG
jgi:hypothetical protein